MHPIIYILLLYTPWDFFHELKYIYLMVLTHLPPYFDQTFFCWFCQLVLYSQSGVGLGWLCHSDVTWAAGCAGLPAFLLCVWGGGGNPSMLALHLFLTIFGCSEAFKSFEWWLMPAPCPMTCVQYH